MKASSDDPQFDVVMLHTKTEDGEGARGLRARPGRLDACEVRPMREGKPLAPGGEVVRLEKRGDSPAYDVHLDCEVPGAAPKASGPVQVATRAYRESWDRTFGSN